VERSAAVRCQRIPEVGRSAALDGQLQRLVRRPTSLWWAARFAEEPVMRGRQDLRGLLVGLCLGLTLGWLLWSGHGPEIPRWAGGLRGADTVLVIVVHSRANLEAIRRSVSPDRIVARSEAGLAIAPQRVVVTSLELAGDLLTLAGWSDRALEIVDLGRRSRNEAAGNKRLSRVAALMNKETLTLGEAYSLLSSM
jgi:hypothetical protein